MKYFLLKLNSENCPSGIGQPKAAEAWDGGRCKPPRTSQTALPEPRDSVAIWVNERYGGRGLTAFAKVSSIDASGAIVVTDVELVPEGRINNAYAAASRVAPFLKIRSVATTACRPLTRTEWSVLIDASATRSRAVQPLLIFRIGYMEAYDGPGSIRGGGAYIAEKGEGGEMWNFAPANGRCYGYVMTRHLAGIDIARIRRFLGQAHTGPVLEGVDIAFIARKPGVGQVVVGAYLNATVHEKSYRQRPNPSPDRKHPTLDYLCEAIASDTFLIPPLQRDFPVPYAPKAGKGFPGHANVWYGDSKRDDVLAFVRRLQTYLRREAQELQSMGQADSVREIVLEDQEREEIDRITNDVRIRETVRWALVRARIGQGLFRKRLESIEQSCRVTGIRERELLRASHIKPWAHSSDREKLDGENGLLLTPHIDHLFDKGFITFSDRARIIVSERLPRAVVRDWKLQGTCPGEPFTPKQRKFLRYHRENVFK
jgi:hypothetical protein